MYFKEPVGLASVGLPLMSLLQVTSDGQSVHVAKLKALTVSLCRRRQFSGMVRQPISMRALHRVRYGLIAPRRPGGHRSTRQKIHQMRPRRIGQTENQPFIHPHKMEPFKVARKSQALPFPHKEAKMEIRMMPPLPVLFPFPFHLRHCRP